MNENVMRNIKIEKVVLISDKIEIIVITIINSINVKAFLFINFINSI
jgi:hypothetical protein